jgi:hypothetical protein
MIVFNGETYTFNGRVEALSEWMDINIPHEEDKDYE